jgi:hypothetical protein
VSGGFGNADMILAGGETFDTVDGRQAGRGEAESEELDQREVL